MMLDRRRLLAMSAAAAPLVAAPARATPIAALGLDATHFGVFPGSPDDQTRALQRAIDQAAGARVPLALPPGVYRAGDLRLGAGTHLVGIRGATRLMLSNGTSLAEANFADRVTLSGLVFDGGGRMLPEGRGLIHLVSSRALRITDCEIGTTGRHALLLDRVDGEVRGNSIAGAGQSGLFSLNARGLTVAGNSVRACGNNGIQIWRSEAGDDGTIVTGNRIEEISARAGGSGQNGNAIGVFRAHNVQVSHNRISGVAFTAVRGNAAAHLQIVSNICSGCGEVALYAEFGSEGAVIAHNTVDGAAIGVAVTNFDHGGRLAVVQGNIIRNLLPKRPPGTDPGDGAGIGISVEADSAVTGNVIEDAPTTGISVGWGHYLRDVTVTGNVVRRAGTGISVSVSPGAGAAVIADNLIADAKTGAIVGTEFKRIVTGDLAKAGAERFAQLAISGNRVR